MMATPRVAERGRRPARGCRVIQRRLILLGDEELFEAEAAALRAHVCACYDCERIERLLRSLLAAIRDVPMPEPEDAYWGRMAEAIMVRVRASRPAWLDRHD